jgi:hypothetical protein
MLCAMLPATYFLLQLFLPGGAKAPCIAMHKGRRTLAAYVLNVGVNAVQEFSTDM